MKKTTIITLIIVAIILICVIYFWFNKYIPPNNGNINQAVNQSYPLPGNYSTYKLENLISDYKNGILKSGKFNTIGTIIDFFDCPPCPLGAVCMPCPGEAIIVAEQDADRNTLDQIMIKAEELDQFKVGKQYKFSISIGAETEDIQLIGYQTQE